MQVHLICEFPETVSYNWFVELQQKALLPMGYFFGCKLHLVVNNKGEIMNFVITHENVNDREPFKNINFKVKALGKLLADKG